ncbi:MAG: GNAT family N-acetyltransferase [Kordiimonadaceae bacterium]|nr:GNAT family N-acetyltransferase [Kordiimonadaceae bacterium]MBT6036909.1 GNAT family N-acetyltransferase [Kordiimonadaceae bacterium]MBT6330427.1 GNAT family N-acetyltransferase [Kordiimonadaceae bacterium]MBT7581605.1 GNAT family N-acetyltransferase [Kordiimonadaceae bacterium]
MGDEKVDGFISGPCDAYIEGGLEDMYVITVSGTVRGFSVIKGNLVELMMMKHEDHRKGWGSTLLSAMEEKLFESHSEIVLDSFENNHKTNQFYLKNGWKNTATEFDEDAGENIYKFIKKK